jgi:hypothetical protein
METEIALMNERLRQDYGEFSPGNPKFRLVWSTKQFECRYGEYNIFSPSGDIFLREEKGIFFVPKYPTWPDMWVLEKLMDTKGNPYLESICRFSYEPVWVFGAGNSERIPIWRAVQLLVRNNLFGDPNRMNRSPKDLQEEEDKKLELEKKKMKEILSEDTSGLAVPLRIGSAVSVQGFRDSEANKRKEEECQPKN